LSITILKAAVNRVGQFVCLLKLKQNRCLPKVDSAAIILEFVNRRREFYHDFFSANWMMRYEAQRLIKAGKGRIWIEGFATPEDVVELANDLEKEITNLTCVNLSLRLMAEREIKLRKGLKK
jgi:hypothetical protein